MPVPQEGLELGKYDISFLCRFCHILPALLLVHNITKYLEREYVFPLFIAILFFVAASDCDNILFMKVTNCQHGIVISYAKNMNDKEKNN